MYIWIDQIKYALHCHPSSEIRLVQPAEGGLPVIYAPANCSLQRIKQYLRWGPTPAESTTEPALPAVMVDQMPLFGQIFSIRLQKNTATKIRWTANRIYCEENWYKRSSASLRADRITRTLFEQFIREAVSQWEDDLDILTGEIRTRRMTRSLYRVNLRNRDMVFNVQNSRLSLIHNECIVASALLAVSATPDDTYRRILRKTPNYEQLKREIKDEHSQYIANY